MNFVEAALLIQGSACVYSKKVGPRPASQALFLVFECQAGLGRLSCWGGWPAHPISDLPCEHLLSPSWIPHCPLPLKNKLGFKAAGPAYNIRPCAGEPQGAERDPAPRVGGPQETML